MKKAIALIMAFAFIIALAAPVYAEHDPGDKLKGGLEDVFTVPYDLVKTTYDTTVDSEFYPIGFLHGLVKGFSHGVVDVATGLVDILTFPVDTHR